MGYSAYAYTCYGYATSESEMFEVKEVRVKKGPKGAKFCPETGKPLFEKKKVSILEGFEYCWEKFTIDEIEFNSVEPNPDSNSLIITVFDQEAGSGDIKSFDPDMGKIKKAKKVLKKALGENWKEENWGIWTMLSESY